MRVIRYIPWVFTLVLAGAALANEPALKVEANRSQLYRGESFLLQITVSGVSRPPDPDLSAITNATIKSLGRQTMSNFSIVIINGQVQRDDRSGCVFSYEITPLRAGPLTAGPITLNVDGRKLSATGPVVTVTDIEPQDLVVMTVSATRETVLIDEPFEVTLLIRMCALPSSGTNLEPLFLDNPPQLQIPWLDGENLSGLTGPDVPQILQSLLVSGRRQPGFAINAYTLAPDMFDFDSLFDLSSRQTHRAVFGLSKELIRKDGQPAAWEYRLTLNYIPRDEGNYVFGPVVFKGTIPVEVDGQGRAVNTNIFTVGAACTVRVIPPPDEGRPLAFTGAIGSNLMAQAVLDTQVCNVGDPLKLTLGLSGPVRFDKMLPPKLALQTNLTAHFTVYDNTVQTTRKNKTCQFVYTLRPNHAGSLELPPIEIPYYDTQSRSYKTAATAAIALQVKRGAEVTASQIVGHTNGLAERKEEPASRTPAAPWTVAAGAEPGILAGKTSLIIPSAAGPAVYLLVLMAGFYRVHRAERALTARRRQAGARFRARLKTVDRLLRTDPAAAQNALCDSLRAYLADKFAVTYAALTPTDAQHLLEKSGIDADRAAEFSAIFERSFNAGFSRQSGTADLQADCLALRNLIAIIDRELDTRGKM